MEPRVLFVFQLHNHHHTSRTFYNQQLSLRGTDDDVKLSPIPSSMDGPVWLRDKILTNSPGAILLEQREVHVYSEYYGTRKLKPGGCTHGALL